MAVEDSVAVGPAEPVAPVDSGGGSEMETPKELQVSMAILRAAGEHEGMHVSHVYSCICMHAGVWVRSPTGLLFSSLSDLIDAGDDMGRY